MLHPVQPPAIIARESSLAAVGDRNAIGEAGLSEHVKTWVREKRSKEEITRTVVLSEVH